MEVDFARFVYYPQELPSAFLPLQYILEGKKQRRLQLSQLHALIYCEV